jgi:hypothetical protein
MSDQKQEALTFCLAREAALHTKNPSEAQNPFVPVQSAQPSQQSATQGQATASNSKKE